MMAKRKTFLSIRDDCDDGYLISFRRCGEDMKQKSSKVIQRLITELEFFRDWHKSEIDSSPTPNGEGE
jgi:hypothetical protein